MEVITTLPHFWAINFSPDLFYSFVIFCSTTLSVLWHMGFSELKILDHIVAGFWFLTDVYYFYDHSFFYGMLYSNISVGLLDFFYSFHPIGHSLWHLLSAAKSTMLVLILEHSKIPMFHSVIDVSL